MDLLGRVVSYTDVYGLRTDTVYDQAGRVTTETVTFPNAADPPQVTVVGYGLMGFHSLGVLVAYLTFEFTSMLGKTCLFHVQGRILYEVAELFWNDATRLRKWWNETGRPAVGRCKDCLQNEWERTVVTSLGAIGVCNWGVCREGYFGG